jgi:hypothetical protein
METLSKKAVSSVQSKLKITLQLLNNKCSMSMKWRKMATPCSSINPRRRHHIQTKTRGQVSLSRMSDVGQILGQGKMARLHPRLNGNATGTCRSKGKIARSHTFE